MILESLSELNEHVGLLGFLKYAGSLTNYVDDCSSLFQIMQT